MADATEVYSPRRASLTDPKTGQSLARRDQPGYYPRFSTLGQKKYWDETTRQVVVDRVEKAKPIRFFTPDEARTMEAVVDRIMPQEDRTPARRIPLLPSIDERLYTDRIDGYRYADMPSDREAYRIGVRAFEQMAQALYGRGFGELGTREQEEILKSIQEGKPQAAQDEWKKMNIDRFWSMLVSDVCGVYYAHPWAWDEIGFGGPAYPRGYMRLEEGEPEPWEVNEQRYEWAAPSDTISDQQQTGAGQEHQSKHSEGGTH